MPGKLDLIPLLGKPIDAEAVKNALGALEATEVTSIEDETYYEFRSSGFSLNVSNDSGEIIAAHIYPEGVDGYQQFVGVLPCSLWFGEGRHAVHARLGVPTTFGGGAAGTPSWEAYEVGRYSCHIEYVAGERVGLVTIMIPGAVPRPDLSGDRH